MTLRFDAVTRRFGTITAVDGVSLDVEEGTFFALLGPSGCGKTTLLRMAAGFEMPDEGRVIVAGEDVTARPPARRPVNMMFQSYALFPHMSVADNVAYGLKMERLPRSEIAARADAAMAMVGLEDLAGRRPDRLSGGQRQRVALARALVKRPKVLLLDEPLAALDRQLRLKMQLELKRIQDETGTTFLVVTHDQEEALVMADRIALMRGGRIEQTGTPRTLYEAPESRFVAAFIGITNFIDGHAATGGLAVAGRTLPGHRVNTAPGEAATLAVRPERVRLGGEGLSGTVREVVYHGGESAVHVAVDGLTDAIVAKLGAGDPQTAIEEGSAVTIGWDANDARILPHDTDADKGSPP
ncbi:MAG: ABC transporter ATP-binding protein [Pseudomonadota bacterium]